MVEHVVAHQARPDLVLSGDGVGELETSGANTSGMVSTLETWFEAQEFPPERTIHKIA